MRIAVLGTGNVGRTIADKLESLGHEVSVGTRDVDAALAGTNTGDPGVPPFAAWADAHPKVSIATYAGAAADAELVVNATAGEASIAALTAAGADGLAGKVLLDIANPLDHSTGFPPTLFVKDTDSLAEQIQAALPGAKVVKALNTLTAALMADPALVAAAEHSVFVCGDDVEAKEVVTGLLLSFGHKDVIDLGELSAARATEMLLPIWLRLMVALKTSMFNIKVVR